MTGLFTALTFASVSFGWWLMVKKDSIQAFFIFLGVSFCFGGGSMLYSNDPEIAEDGGLGIAVGVLLILLTFSTWNALNRVTGRGPYKTNKD